MLGIWTNMATIVAETQRVAWLSMIKMASGFSAAQDDAALMTSEKVATAARATARLVSRSTPDSVVRSSRKKVRAHTRRMSMGSPSVKRRAQTRAAKVKPQISEPRSQISRSRDSKPQTFKSRGKR
jgi:hypothetical protein